MANDGKSIARASDGTFNGMASLTEKQRQFVLSYTLNGGNAVEAARTAGYSHPQTAGYQVAQLPHVQAAIRAERAREIETKGATIAWATMQDLMTNPRYTGAVKFQAARWTLEAAGHGLEAQRAKLGLPDGDKPLSEMSLSELEAFLSAGGQALRALKEGQMPVIEGEILPNARDNARNSAAERTQVTDLTGGGVSVSSPTQDDDAQDEDE